MYNKINQFILMKCDCFAAVGITMILFFSSFTTIIQSALNIFEINIFPISKVILSLSIMLCLVSMIKKKVTRESIFFWTFFFMLLVISYLFFPSNREYLFKEVIIYSCFLGFPAFFAIRYIENINILFKVLKSTSQVVIVSQFLLLLMEFMGFDFAIRSIGMEVNYQVVVALCMILFTKKSSIIDYLIIVIGSGMVVFGYGRGAILCLFVYIVYNFLKRYNIPNIVRRTSIKKKVILSFGISLLFLIMIFLGLSMNSRVIESLVSGDFFNPNGRDQISKYTTEIINDHPYFGVGMTGDRVLLKEYGYLRVSYTHNIFTELILDYGIPLGVIMIFYLLFLEVKILLLKNNSRAIYIFVVLWMTLGFMKLLFSSSYLMEPAFFMTIALAFKIKKEELL